MMKSVRPLLFLLLAVLAGACTGQRMRNAFEESDAFRLMVGGQIMFEYEPNSCQLAFSRTDKEFRAHTDNMSDFYIVRFDEVPASQGQRVTAELTWTTEREVLTRKNITLVVVRDEGDQFWLWSNASRIGLVVRVLE